MNKNKSFLNDALIRVLNKDLGEIDIPSIVNLSELLHLNR